MNRQYHEMLNAAILRLGALDLSAAAFAAGIEYDPPRMALTSFGQAVTLYTTDFHTEPDIDMWHHLALLQYLEGVNGALPCGRWIGLAELPGGGVRGASFDREIDRLIAAGLNEAALPEACRGLGGRIEANTAADFSAVFDTKLPLNIDNPAASFPPWRR